MRIAALLLAAGTGRRFASSLNQARAFGRNPPDINNATDAPPNLPKQFWRVHGKTVIRHAAEALRPHVDIMQPVGDPVSLDDALRGLDTLPTIPGGAERHESVRAGLEALALLPTPPDYVLVHDGARPYVPARVTRAVCDALTHAEAVIPAIKLSDTLKRVSDGIIHDTVCRDNLYRAQTPQGFHFASLLNLHRSHPSAETDDAALFEAAGRQVVVVKGDDDNIKLTEMEDLLRLEKVFCAGAQTRTGMGYDVHAFETGRDLIICGIKIPHDRGLAGHSDADVGIHTLCDAIYGALAEGDIGFHFPPSQDTWKDMDSARFLVHAGDRIRARGGMLINADITIICERPKIGPHVLAMRTRLSELLQVDIGRISVKATTSERLGFTGREEGIAATAVASVLLP